jgi:hypothetical protein
MGRSFRYQRAEGFDPLAPVWHVTCKKTNLYVGVVRRDGPNNYEVRRYQDADFHSSFGSRIEAAKWLKGRLSDRAIFDEDEDKPEDEDASD